jgi:xanthine/CO dehydrogenase XdhC/CoxF family maturation factor
VIDTGRILAELAKAGYHITDTARKLHVTVDQVKDAVREGSQDWPDIGQDDGGPVSLRPHLVATKRADETWSREDDKAIRMARRKYNAGLVEISQMSRDGWTRMYAIPRREQCAPRNYFPAEML